ncbi:GNAT family N-acetyltransferase [Montanilutibacter psychrotolerans]|uniref:GNAT family N-acetyltransferase n=1 Tax=Montanilutibacter psychrotolerans TaxID=1327343 RepID=A0A3M8T3F6_9GAMM|nr:GNAT family N-acetyltransferase [Lysobacter psychrotolerans]RNF86064.1 GNAT family N-acetyltransferase [Lysobacter psychrotolerans]
MTQHLVGDTTALAEPPLIIEAADARFFNEARAIDFSFTIDREILPAFDTPLIDRCREIAPYRKRYDSDPEDYREHLEATDQALFVARLDGQLVGYLAIRSNWNALALIDDIAVSRTARRQGCARALMDRAVDWARSAELSGIMLETQNNNVAACLFYERYGFVLGGIDRMLYAALESHAPETALFWYLQFPR